MRNESSCQYNSRIKIGAYGGTTEASKTPVTWSLLADINNDGTVNLLDYNYQAHDWLKQETNSPVI